MERQEYGRPGDRSPDPDTATLNAYGWDRAWAAEAAGMEAGRVVARHRDGWRIVTAVGPVRVAVGGGGRADPAVGDWVTLNRAGSGLRLGRILTRRSALVRRDPGRPLAEQVLAANVDIVLLLEALAPALNTRRLERAVALAWESGAVPVVVLTKSDLAGDVVGALADVATAAPGVEALAVSVVRGTGLEALTERLPPARTAVLLGASGAGKSTLLNHLLGDDRMRIGAVRGDGRGRHTTTHRELVRLPTGGLVIDSPGFRELGLWSDGGLDAAFADIMDVAGSCRFRDCAHDTEPGCAVLGAVEAGELSADRLEHWRALQRELAWLERRSDPEAAAAEVARWRAIERSVRHHPKRKLQDGEG